MIKVVRESGGMVWTRDLPTSSGFYWIDHPEWPQPVVAWLCSVSRAADAALVVLLVGMQDCIHRDDFGILHPDVVWSTRIESPPRDQTR